MYIENTALPGIKILIPKRFEDKRGFFSESWNKREMEMLGLKYEFVQDSHSFSITIDTLRGLHFQSPPHAQTKLVRCGQGRMLDVVVDFREGSPTFGNWVGLELSFQNGKQLLIPPGFLHGFVTRSPNTEVIYKSTNYYSSDCDYAVRFDDPDIGIDWGLNGKAIVSDKDASAPLLKNIKSPFVWN